VLAGKNCASYQKDNKKVVVKSNDLFAHTWKLNFDTVGELTAYPNRDSLPYIDIYGLAGIETLYRGTLRYPGWCETWKLISDIGLLCLDERNDLAGKTYKDLLAEITACNPSADIKKAVAEKFKRPIDGIALANLEWLGLFSEETITGSQNTVLDILSDLLQEKMQYGPEERDMIVLHHDFKASYPDKPAEKITSTLVAYGEPGGVSAMAKTVSLPAAIAVKLILNGKINLTGAQIPVEREVYIPVLKELEELGVTFTERTIIDNNE
jgi:saccharopine dehydrogenase (NADP+, L-glutamate forming)/spermidine synthase